MLGGPEGGVLTPSQKQGKEVVWEEEKTWQGRREVGGRSLSETCNDTFEVLKNRTKYFMEQLDIQ